MRELVMFSILLSACAASRPHSTLPICAASPPAAATTALAFQPDAPAPPSKLEPQPACRPPLDQADLIVRFMNGATVAQLATDYMAERDEVEEIVRAAVTRINRRFYGPHR